MTNAPAAHDGRVAVESSEGAGMTLRIELPLRDPPPSPLTEAGAAGRGVLVSSRS